MIPIRAVRVVAASQDIQAAEGNSRVASLTEADVVELIKTGDIDFWCDTLFLLDAFKLSAGKAIRLHRDLAMEGISVAYQGF